MDLDDSDSASYQAEPPLKPTPLFSSPGSSQAERKTPEQIQQVDDFGLSTSEVKRGYHLLYPGQEETRRLALVILATLVASVLIVGAILTGLAGDDDKKLAGAREFVEIGFVPLLGLLGSAVAYYYTSK